MAYFRNALQHLGEIVFVQARQSRGNHSAASPGKVCESRVGEIPGNLAGDGRVNGTVRIAGALQSDLTLEDYRKPHRRVTRPNKDFPRRQSDLFKLPCQPAELIRREI